MAFSSVKTQRLGILVTSALSPSDVSLPGPRSILDHLGPKPWLAVRDRPLVYFRLRVLCANPDPISGVAPWAQPSRLKMTRLLPSVQLDLTFYSPVLFTYRWSPKYPLSINKMDCENYLFNCDK